MEQIVLNNKDKIKFDLLKGFTQKKQGYSLIEMMTMYDLSKSSTIRYINELNEDLSQLFDAQVSIIFFQDKRYRFSKQDLFIDSYVIDQMRCYYLNNSTPVLVLNAILTKKYPSMEKLSIDLNLSNSAIYKSMAVMQQLTENFNGKITFNSRTSNIEGDELGVRLFIYFLYWSMYRTTQTNPFGPHMPNDYLTIDHLRPLITDRKVLSLSQTTKLSMLQGITLYRINYRKIKINLEPDLAKDIALFNPDNFRLPKITADLTEEEKKQESDLFVFFTKLLIADIDSFDRKKQLVNHYQEADLEISQRITQFIHQFENYMVFHFSKEGYIEIYYLLLILFIYFQYINIDFSKFHTDMTYVNRPKALVDEFKQVENNLYLFIKKNVEPNFLKTIPEDILNMLSHVLFFCYHQNLSPNSIKVHIQMSKNIYIGRSIQKFLTNTFNKDTITFTLNPENADLIISDTFEGVTSHPHQEHLYFDNQYDYQNWNMLLSEISTIIYQKVFLSRVVQLDEE
ncbi:helix-turn-helix domain-containing protein [Vagococcus humatus]|uniref:Mga helix-turn-helix domain-containing protein n=1 Tax=Vagococcus humatus TaxID=1889241 RepID=A0A3R9ZWH3_9ENTE|nr:helix-turn-helix domain-containing protein [Vagococcus humatus]RST89396.1 hypothetical protein C7P63_06380 [Vagococcus humatus]